ncbi:hypothetical protein EVAR_50975_1 [Eumeta japonica]|uniref:Uncharacterized protein n=1 Tax=Eumeta variegata TaxID=151549 RepID=A0A4C1X9X5_EUMVA|nr:hypothetical protein EVAR_50975_1 [Eumeta japonica]
MKFSGVTAAHGHSQPWGCESESISIAVLLKENGINIEDEIGMREKERRRLCNNYIPHRQLNALSEPRSMHLICAGGCAIYKLKHNWCIHPPASPDTPQVRKATAAPTAISGADVVNNKTTDSRPTAPPKLNRLFQCF